ncbi:MAG: hypothetical protein MUC29_00465 [Pyrinomonadaceae bacterium]|nr:hypothetical protein [Pyrinomonadaceae bacterium]
MKKILFLILITCLATTFAFAQKTKKQTRSKSSLNIKVGSMVVKETITDTFSITQAKFDKDFHFDD